VHELSISITLRVTLLGAFQGVLGASAGMAYSLPTSEPGAVCVAFLCVCGGLLSAWRSVGFGVARPLLYASCRSGARSASVIGGEDRRGTPAAAAVGVIGWPGCHVSMHFCCRTRGVYQAAPHPRNNPSHHRKNEKRY